MTKKNQVHPKSDPTSNPYNSRRVGPIYLKIGVLRVPLGTIATPNFKWFWLIVSELLHLEVRSNLEWTCFFGSPFMHWFRILSFRSISYTFPQYIMRISAAYCVHSTQLILQISASYHAHFRSLSCTFPQHLSCTFPRHIVHIAVQNFSIGKLYQHSKFFAV